MGGLRSDHLIVKLLQELLRIATWQQAERPKLKPESDSDTQVIAVLIVSTFPVRENEFDRFLKTMRYAMAKNGYSLNLR